MIKNHGLKMLCDLLVSENDDQVLAKVVSSLKTLSSSVGLTLHASTTLAAEINLVNQTQLGKRKLDDNIKLASEGTSIKCPKLDLISSPSNSDCDGIRAEGSSSCKYDDNHHGPCDIKFQVDSGEQIAVHPEILSSMSEMFAAMLSSNYKEGSMPVIPIRQVSLNALTCVIHSGYGCTPPVSFDQEDTECSSVCSHLQTVFDSYELKSRFQFMVELLAIADRFLMSNLKGLIEKLLMSLTTESNIVSLILSAAHYHSKTLCEFGLKFLLLKVSDLDNQFWAFREIFKSHDRQKLLDILYEVLFHQLQKQQ